MRDMRALILSLLLSLSLSAAGQTWVIQSNNDSGAGSLRTALDEANTLCGAPEVACSITFFDHPELIPQTIELRTALPVVTACNLTIRSQVRAAGLPDATWGIRPAFAIELAEGLVLRPRCEASRITVDGLSVQSFNGDAVAVLGAAQATYTFNRLNLSGQSRGLAVDAPKAAVALSNSTIGHTSRSSVTLWSAANSALTNVRLRNSGASGIFVGPNGGALTVRNSLIHDHAQFGIAVARGNGSFVLDNTRIYNTAVMDIDYGLDGPTDTAPLVTSAIYNEARNLTIITVDPRHNGPARIEVWASLTLTMFGTAHLDRFITSLDTNTGSVEIEAPGDLSRRFISALRVDGTRVSEVGGAVVVR